MKWTILLCLLVGLIALNEAKSYKKTWLEAKLRKIAENRRIGGQGGQGKPGEEEGQSKPVEEGGLDEANAPSTGEEVKEPEDLIGEEKGPGEEGGKGGEDEYAQCYTLEEIKYAIAQLYLEESGELKIGTGEDDELTGSRPQKEDGEEDGEQTGSGPPKEDGEEGGEPKGSRPPKEDGEGGDEKTDEGSNNPGLLKRKYQKMTYIAESLLKILADSKRK